MIVQRASNLTDNPRIVSRRDTITGEEFYQILRIEAGNIIAEERTTPDMSSDNNLISQAKLDPQGQTEFTLTFTGNRFQARDANPNIVHSKSFPNATVFVFDTLSRAVESGLRQQSVPTQNTTQTGSPGK